MKTITILSVVDVLGALADGRTRANLYLFDDNKINGSFNQGTGVLKTKVSVGDTLLWTLVALECESYAAISHITIDPEVCVPQQRFYPDSDVSYWEGQVLKEVLSAPYKITLEVGAKRHQIETTDLPALIG